MARPLSHTDPNKLQLDIDNYFKACDRGRKVDKIEKGKVIKITEQIPYTIPGLAHAIGFNSKQALYNYGNPAKHKSMPEDVKRRFVDSIKRARLKIETYLAEKVVKTGNPGPMFVLKALHGYQDRVVETRDADGQITSIQVVRYSDHEKPGKAD